MKLIKGKNIKAGKVSELSGENLDCWVAKAYGYEVLGKAFAYYDPESGTPCVDSNQNHVLPLKKDTMMGFHQRYFYVSRCDCKLCDDMHIEMLESYPDMTPEPKILGHDWRCLEPVLSYSTQSQYVGEIIKAGKIMVVPVLLPQISEKDKHPIASWNATCFPPAGEETKERVITMPGRTLEEAVMRAFVASKFGKTVSHSVI